MVVFYVYFEIVYYGRNVTQILVVMAECKVTQSVQ